MKLKISVIVWLVFSASFSYSLESEMPELLNYSGIPFQNATLSDLEESLGEARIFDPPGEVLLPDQVCYVSSAGMEVTFFLEHYGNPQFNPEPVVIGVSISEDHNEDVDDLFRRPFPCDEPKIDLPHCVGSLCIGDTRQKVEEILKKEMTYPSAREWHFEVNLSPDDLVMKAYPSANANDGVPDWMYPSHIVRVRFVDGKVADLYVVVDIDMA